MISIIIMFRKKKESNNIISLFAKIRKIERKLSKSKSKNLKSPQWPGRIHYSTLSQFKQNIRKSDPQKQNKAEKIKDLEKAVEQRFTKSAGRFSRTSIVKFNLQKNPLQRRIKTCKRLNEKPLYQQVLQQKMLKLEKQKVDILKEIVSKEGNPQGYFEDEFDEQPNAMSPKAYFYLNQLLDVKEKMFKTMNYRPKSSIQIVKQTPSGQIKFYEQI